MAVCVAGEAKFAAEAHPGVGQETDMVTITKDGMSVVPAEMIQWVRTRREDRKKQNDAMVLPEKPAETTGLAGN